jgi:hypothetical protein
VMRIVVKKLSEDPRWLPFPLFLYLSATAQPSKKSVQTKNVPDD